MEHHLLNRVDLVVLVEVAVVTMLVVHIREVLLFLDKDLLAETVLLVLMVVAAVVPVVQVKQVNQVHQEGDMVDLVCKYQQHSKIQYQQ
jgi:hypothetical protein